jgi:RNA polymerase sigma factor (sigma-70 family)
MSRRTLIQQLFADHANTLQAFFRRRLREQRDASDLTQEVYLRLLRANEAPIHNPEAYLFTVANNLLKETSITRRREQRRVDLTHPTAVDFLNTDALASEADLAYGIDLAGQLRGLRAVLPELSPRCQQVLVMTFEEELSQQHIAERLGISKSMVHKILTQGISHCRKRLAQENPL